jgi:hypothetical protein
LTCSEYRLLLDKSTLSIGNPVTRGTLKLFYFTSQESSVVLKIRSESGK